MNMSEIIGYVVAILTIIGTLGSFFSWLFRQFAKKWEHRFDLFEMKFTHLEKTVHELTEDTKDQRKRSDQLYQIVIDLLRDKKPKTDP